MASKYISVAETAKLVREALKKRYPKTVFSVRSKSYSGGASIDIAWVDGPAEASVDDLVARYRGADFDPMQDLKTVRSAYNAQGQEVRYGADYIFCRRGYSAAVLQRYAETTWREWGWEHPIPAIEAGDKGEARFLSQKRLEGGYTDVEYVFRALRKADLSRGLPSLPKPKDLSKVASQLRKLADGMQEAIDDKFRPRLENTARRSNQASSMRQDGRRLQVIQDKLRALADGHEDGSLPRVLAQVQTRALVEQILLYRDYPVWDEDKAHRLAQAGIESRHYDEARARLLALGQQDVGEKTLGERIRDAERELLGIKLEGFYPTPRKIAQMMLDYAELEAGMRVLEPSAGTGNLADAIYEREPEVQVTVCEIAPRLRSILELKGYSAEWDCLDIKGTFERVIMNPPFERGQDMEHVQAMFERLVDGGRLVSVMSEGVFFRQGKREIAFRAWLEALGGESIQLPENSFKESGTGVNTRIVILDKPMGVKAPLSDFTAPALPTLTPEPSESVLPATRQLPLFSL